VTVVAPIVRVSNQLPFGLRCGLSTSEDAAPDQHDTCVINANQDCGVPISTVGLEGDHPSWSALFLKVRLVDAEEGSPDGSGGGGDLKWSTPLRINTSVSLDGGKLIGDRRTGDASIGLFFTQDGIDYAVTLEVHCREPEASPNGFRHLVITCPIVVRNKTGLPLDFYCPRPAGEHGHTITPSVWKPRGSALSAPGLLGIPSNRIKSLESMRLVVGNAGWKGRSRILSNCAKFSLFFAWELCQIAPSPLGRGFAAIWHRPLGCST
jgi:hypothetical protein